MAWSHACYRSSSTHKSATSPSPIYISAKLRPRFCYCDNVPVPDVKNLSLTCPCGIPKFGDDLRKVIERNLIFYHLTTRPFCGIVLQRNPVMNRRASHSFITGASRNNHAVEPSFWLLFVDKTRFWSGFWQHRTCKYNEWQLGKYDEIGHIEVKMT